MFGIDAPELLVIAVVALIFIGPKELPGMLRTLGKWIGTARNMAGEFRGHVDDMMRQAELDELKKQVETGAKDAVLDLQGLDPTREIRAAIEEGASEADKEMATTRAAIEAKPGDPASPASEPAELAALLGDPAPTPAVTAGTAPAEPEFAAVPPAVGTAGMAAGENAPPADPSDVAASRDHAAADKPAIGTQKIAVG